MVNATPQVVQWSDLLGEAENKVVRGLVDKC